MTTSILYCLTAGAAITDTLKNRIFNNWLMLGAAAGLMLNLITKELNKSLAEIIIKFLMVTIVLLPVYLVKGIGGGDLKLFSVISIFLPMGETISCIMISFIIGAAFGLVKMIITKNRGETIHFAIPILISTLMVSGNNALICM